MQADKYAVAWFKIADYVSRGERERALGVYRLLSHSFNDAAIAHQLEGDIYFAFHDFDKAISLYYQAAHLYKKSKRFLEAAAVYEHLVMLKEDTDLYHILIDLYILLGITVKIQKYGVLLVMHYAHQHQWKTLDDLFDMLSDQCAAIRSSLYCTLIVALKEMEEPVNRIQEYSEKAIKDFSLYDDQTCLQEFLLAIQAIDDDLYEYAFDYIKRM